MGRFFVRRDQTGVRCRRIHAGEAPLRLLDRRGVDLAELGLRRPEPSTEPLTTGGIDEDRRVLAEQFVRRELLVDLQPDLQAEGPIIHGLRNRKRGINPSLAETRALRLSAGFPPAQRFESPTARVPAPARRSVRRLLSAPSTGCGIVGSRDILGAAPGPTVPVRHPSKGGSLHRNRGRALAWPPGGGGGGAGSPVSGWTRRATPSGRRTRRSS